MPEETKTTRNVEISAALDGGFSIRNRDSYELLAVVPNLGGIEPRLRAIFATTVTLADPEFDEVGDTATKSNTKETVEMASAFYLSGINGSRGSSALRAAAKVIIKVTTDAGPVEYGFLDEKAGYTAYTMLYITGANPELVKNRDGHSTEQAEATDGSGPVEDPTTVDRPAVYIVTAGTNEDPEKTVTAYYDESVAKRVCETVWAAGGRASIRPARYI